VNEFVLCRSALMNGLLQSIQDKPSIGCAACPPSDNPARKYIHDESCAATIKVRFSVNQDETRRGGGVTTGGRSPTGVTPPPLRNICVS